MGKKIMVIDDAKSIRDVVKLVLNEAGYSVIEADNGNTALSKLNDEEKVDMFICDVNMPEMNGIEFLSAIKNDTGYAKYKFTPIVMLTTEAGDQMKAKGKELGAKAWLVKPFQPNNLIEMVEKLLV